MKKMDEIREKKRRVRDAKRTHKEASKAFNDARDQVQTVLKAAEAEALREYNEATAPFLKTYQIAMSTAFRKAQDESTKVWDAFGDRDRETYRELIQAGEDLREEAEIA